MGLKLMDAVGESGLAARLKPYAMVWARKANDDGTKCRAGVGFVAEYLGKKPQIVRRARNALIAMGVLEAETTTRYGRRWVKVVAFDAECLPERGTAVLDQRTAVPDLGTAVPDRGTAVPVGGTAVPRTSRSTSLGTSHGTSWVETQRSRESQALARGADFEPQSLDDDPEDGPTTDEVTEAYFAAATGPAREDDEWP